MHRPLFSRRGPSLHGHCPASPLLRPHPTTAFAFANCSPPKFPCRTFGKCRPLCPAASTLPESSQQGDVGFTSTETLTTRKHLTRLYVGSSLALRPIPLSGKTPAHRSPFARLAVLIVCRFLYDIAPSAISSAELCLAYLWQFTVVIKSCRLHAADVHPALSSPSATPLRSGGYAGKVKRADGTSASAETTKKNAPYGR